MARLKKAVTGNEDAASVAAATEVPASQASEPEAAAKGEAAATELSEVAQSAASPEQQTDLIDAIAKAVEAPIAETVAADLAATVVEVNNSAEPQVDKVETKDSGLVALDPRSVTIRVTASAGSRRRAGFGFGPTPRDLTFSEIIDAGLDPETVVKALLADPFLSVAPVPPTDI